MQYQEMFDRVAPNFNRKGYVFSEPELFLCNDKNVEMSRLESNPNSSDYNALIAWLPSDFKLQISSYSWRNKASIGAQRILMNPLFSIDLHRQEMYVDRSKYDGQVDYLLKRHPIYVDRIADEVRIKLQDETVRFLWYAFQGYTVSEIGKKVSLEEVQMKVIVDHLEKSGAATMLPISFKAFQMQTFTGLRQRIENPNDCFLNIIWDNAFNQFGSRICIENEEDGSEFTDHDINEVIQRVESKFDESGLIKGDTVLCCSELHLEAIVVFWACVRRRVIFSVINPEMSDRNFLFVIKNLCPKSLFASINQCSKADKTYDGLNIIFDSELEGDHLFFSDWLEQTELSSPKEVVIATDDSAVILYTSGSTGNPKGVVLSHSNLVQSAKNVIDTFHLSFDDICLPMGGLDSMSGLRNNAIVTIMSGAKLIIPKLYGSFKALEVSELVSSTNVTIISTNPSLLRQWVAMADKVRSNFKSVRTVMSKEIF